MKKISGIIILMLIATLIIGCVGSGMEGKYYNVNNTDIYLEFKSDGTFFMGTSAGGISGTYKIENGEISFIFQGYVIKGTIKGQDIIADFDSKDGDIWSKIMPKNNKKYK